MSVRGVDIGWTEKPWPGLIWLLLAALLAGLVGCQPKPAVTPAAMRAEPMPTEMAYEVGDVIETKFFYAPELNETQTIRPDGKIVLQLVGEVVAEGKSPAQLMDEIKQRYARILYKPEVTVITRQLVARRVYVGGEVMAPGPVDMPGQLDVLAAIMIAGGFNPLSAEVSNVVIIRHKNGQRYGTSVDFRKALAGQTDERLLLHPRDIVFVPKTTIANVNQWIDQHINRIIPQLSVSGAYPQGSGTLGFDLTRR